VLLTHVSQVWISPVVSQIPQVTRWGQAYHGYWTHDFFALNPHCGSPDDLRTLSAALHQRGMVCLPLVPECVVYM
jgi:alpha-amylase